MEERGVDNRAWLAKAEDNEEVRGMEGGQAQGEEEKMSPSCSSSEMEVAVIGSSWLVVEGEEARGMESEGDLARGLESREELVRGMESGEDLGRGMKSGEELARGNESGEELARGIESGEELARGLEIGGELASKVVKYEGTLKITVKQGEDLEKKDFLQKADPYVVVTYGDQKFQSEAVANCLSPVWEYTATLAILPCGPPVVDFQLFDWETLGRAEAMGGVGLPVPLAVSRSGQGDFWLQLEDCTSGRILVETHFTARPEGGDQEDVPGVKPDIGGEVAGDGRYTADGDAVRGVTGLTLRLEMEEERVNVTLVGEDEEDGVDYGDWSHQNDTNAFNSEILVKNRKETDEVYLPETVANMKVLQNTLVTREGNKLFYVNSLEENSCQTNNNKKLINKLSTVVQPSQYLKPELKGEKYIHKLKTDKLRMPPTKDVKILAKVMPYLSTKDKARMVNKCAADVMTALPREAKEAAAVKEALEAEIVKDLAMKSRKKLEAHRAMVEQEVLAGKLAELEAKRQSQLKADVDRKLCMARREEVWQASTEYLHVQGIRDLAEEKKQKTVLARRQQVCRIMIV